MKASFIIALEFLAYEISLWGYHVMICPQCLKQVVRADLSMDRWSGSVTGLVICHRAQMTKIVVHVFSPWFALIRLDHLQAAETYLHISKRGVKH